MTEWEEAPGKTQDLGQGIPAQAAAPATRPQ